jgi:hypothetical protein
MAKRKPKTYPSLKLVWSRMNQTWFVLWPGRGRIEDQQVLSQFQTLSEAEDYADRISSKDNPRARTTEDEWTVQGNYGYGWEDLTAADTWKEIKQNLREYRENEPGTSFRAIKRRVKISPQDNPQPWSRVFG